MQWVCFKRWRQRETQSFSRATTSRDQKLHAFKKTFDQKGSPYQHLEFNEKLFNLDKLSVHHLTFSCVTDAFFGLGYLKHANYKTWLGKSGLPQRFLNSRSSAQPKGYISMRGTQCYSCVNIRMCVRTVYHLDSANEFQLREKIKKSIKNGLPQCFFLNSRSKLEEGRRGEMNYKYENLNQVRVHCIISLHYGSAVATPKSIKKKLPVSSYTTREPKQERTLP